MREFRGLAKPTAARPRVCYHLVIAVQKNPRREIQKKIGREIEKRHKGKGRFESYVV